MVRAPKIDFDNQKRSIVAESDKSQKVSSLFMQQSQDGKQSPMDVTSDKLTYVDEERRARYHRQCAGQERHGTVTAQQIDVYLKEADPSSTASATNPAEKPAQKKGPALPGSEQPSKIDHMVASAMWW